MKGLKILFCVFCLLAISACSSHDEAAWEYVTDDVPEEVVAQTEPYSIFVFAPADAVCEATNPAQTETYYVQENGDYCIRTQHLLGASADGVIRQITKEDADRLTVLQLTRFGLPEYRFAWYADDMVHRGDVIKDGEHYYAVVVSVKEELCGQYADLASQVFSSIGLNGREV